MSAKEYEEAMELTKEARERYCERLEQDLPQPGAMATNPLKGLPVRTDKSRTILTTNGELDRDKITQAYKDWDWMLP